MATLQLIDAGPTGCCPLCFRRGVTAMVLADADRRLKKCRVCDVHYVEPMPSRQEISAHFSDEYITSEERLENSFGRTREEVFSRVARYVQKRKISGRILDVGCAGGYFLHRFFAHRRWEGFGVEPSKFAAVRAGERGITIYCTDLISADLPPSSFDVVTVLDTFYYFPEPRRELRAIRRVLKPSGLLVVELPLGSSQIWRNATKPGRLLGGTPRSLLGSGHVFFYTPKSVSHVLRECGFKPEEYVPLPGNAQRTAYLNLAYRAYYSVSFLLWYLTRGRVMLGPAFLVAASPCLD